MPVLPARPSARAVRFVALGFAVGVVGGWLAGLLRAPAPAPAHGMAR